MAMAGMPPSASPSRARNTSSCIWFWASAHSTVSAAASAMAVTISGLRPSRSDSTLDATSENASVAVETDSVRLLCAGVSANWCDSTGISGCTQYNRAKLEKPPKNSARLVRLNAGVPAAMRGRAEADMMALSRNNESILGLLINTVQYIFKALLIL